MELSVNFLITIIISLVIFGFGIKFGYDLIKQGDNMVSGMKQADENRLKGMLDPSSKVAMFEGMIKLKKGEAKIVGVGVLNLLDTNKQFSLVVTEVNYYPNEVDPAQGFPPSPTVTHTMLIDNANLQVQEKKVFSFSVKAENGASKGTYVFNVKVNDPDGVYGDPHQLFVNVN